MTKRYERKQKSAFTRDACHAVENNINQAREKYIGRMTEPWDKSIDWILEQCFPDHVRSACVQGYEFTTDTVRHHNSFSLEIMSDVRLQLGGRYLDIARMLPPREEHLIAPVVTCIPELVEHCKRVRQILYDYAKVVHVFNWFNTCGSSAIALRNYCPWIQTVLPGRYHSYIEGTRFREPDGLAPMLDLIREVAGIMGRALLIQGEVGDIPKHGVHLHFTTTYVNNIMVPGYMLEL